MAPTADRAALVALAAGCRQFSPVVGLEESAAPESLLLDVTGKLQAADRSSGIPLLGKAPQFSRSSRDDRDNASTGRTFLLLTPKILATEEVEQAVVGSIAR